MSSTYGASDTASIFSFVIGAVRVLPHETLVSSHGPKKTAITIRLVKFSRPRNLRGHAARLVDAAQLLFFAGAPSFLFGVIIMHRPITEVVLAPIQVPVTDMVTGAFPHGLIVSLDKAASRPTGATALVADAGLSTQMDAFKIHLVLSVNVIVSLLVASLALSLSHRFFFATSIVCIAENSTFCLCSSYRPGRLSNFFVLSCQELDRDVRERREIDPLKSHSHRCWSVPRREHELP